MAEKEAEGYAVQASPYVAGALVNIRGGTVDDFRTNLGQVTEHVDEIAGNLAAITAAGNVHGVMHGAVSSGTAAPAQAPAPAPTAPPAAPPDGGNHVCAHGPRQYKSGTNKQGKAYAGWMCGGNVPRAQQCPAEWVSS